jgi:hypothetical protein
MSGEVPNQVFVHQDAPNQVIVEEDAPTVIEVRLSGASAGNTRRHIHTQSSPASSWTVSHSLGGKPSVMVVDTADTVVFGEVTYISNSEIRVDFTAAFAGYVYLT